MDFNYKQQRLLALNKIKKRDSFSFFLVKKYITTSLQPKHSETKTERERKKTIYFFIMALLYRNTTSLRGCDKNGGGGVNVTAIIVIHT